MMKVEFRYDDKVVTWGVYNTLPMNGHTVVFEGQRYLIIYVEWNLDRLCVEVKMRKLLH